MSDQYKIGDLISAVKEGRLEKVREIITSVDLSYLQAWSKKHGYVLLRDAITYNNNETKIAKLLLAYGFNINRSNKKPHNTVLHCAVRYGDLKLVEMLLDRGAEIDAKNIFYKTPLHIAVEGEKIKIIELLLSRGAKGMHSKSALHFSVINKNLNIVKLLLKHKADVNCVCTFQYLTGYTPLHCAVLSKNKEIIKFLLHKGANVNAKGKIGLSVLHLAVEAELFQIVEYLLNQGANINSAYTSMVSKDYGPLKYAFQYDVKLLHRDGYYTFTSAPWEGYTPLHVAALRDNKEITKLLLSRGANIGAKGKDNKTAFHIAAAKGNLQIVKEFLKYIIDDDMLYNSTYRKGYSIYTTPLHTAIKYRQNKIAKLLISHGLYINVQDETGKNAIFYAIERANSDITKLLLTNGACIKYNPELLNIAVKTLCREIVEDLLRHGANINSSDEYGRTPLHFIALDKRNNYDHYEDDERKMVKLLLNRGANINAQTKSGITTLHAACQNGCLEVVEALLAHNEDANVIDFETVNISDKYGRTALYFTALNKTKEWFNLNKGDKGKIAKLLLNRGANINAQTKSGMTTLHAACQNGCLEVVEALLAHNADANVIDFETVNISDKYGRTALYFTALNETKEWFNWYKCYKGKIAKLLLNRGANVNAQTKSGITTFHDACQNGFVEIVEALLEFDADIDSKNGDGRTALHIAVHKNDLSTVKVLLKFGADIDAKDQNNKTALQIHSECRSNYRPRNTRDLDNEFFIAHSLECRIMEMKTANLYVSPENLVFSNNKAIGFDKNECEKEVASMKSEKINNTNVSFYDILTKNINKLARYAANESIVQVLRSNNYKRKFPIYGSMINNHFKKGEKRKKLLERSNKIFFFFFNNFRLPQECTEQIFNYLSNEEFQLMLEIISVSSPNS